MSHAAPGVVDAPAADAGGRLPAPDTLRLYYGGTFDPVHEGHLATARAARDALRCTVRLVPAADPPHRARPGAEARQRAEMLRLAIGDEPGLCVDLRELGRDGPSYTVDTLRDLRATHGDEVPIALLVGADSLLGLTTWRAWRTLFSLAHVVVADRPGSDLERLPPGELADALAGRWAGSPAELLARPAGRVLRLAQPLHPASATEVRERIATGRALQGLLPDAVAAYVRAHGLYRAPLHGVPTPPPL